jgi:branched-chain amino acid transport system ATP-binding protein
VHRSETANPTTPAALELEGVGAGYGKSQVLHDVSLRLQPGTVAAVLGPNGAGKTTLLRVAGGFLRPRHGQVRLLGNDAAEWDPARRANHGLCDIPEGRAIFPTLTVRENLQMFIPKGRAKRAVEHVAEEFPAVGRHLGRIAGTMSGGEQQILALTRAFITNPKIVLIDEVSMGLSPTILDEVFGMLAELRRRGAALLLVEQYVQRALALSDHVYVLTRGRIAFSGSAESAADIDLEEHYFHRVEQVRTPEPAQAMEA